MSVLSTVTFLLNTQTSVSQLAPQLTYGPLQQDENLRKAEPQQLVFPDALYNPTQMFAPVVDASPQDSTTPDIATLDSVTSAFTSALSTSSAPSSTSTKKAKKSKTTSSDSIATPSGSTLAASVYTQQQPSKNGLVPGEVFGLVTLSDDPAVDKETVVIYEDGTLGIKEPTTPGYLFESVLLEDHGLLLAPEPLKTVKFNDQNVFFLNDSLFNPAPVFVANGWDLNTIGGKAAVCPSWNSVLTFIPVGDSSRQCQDAVDVQLRIVPITNGP